VECEEEEVHEMQDNFFNCTQHFKQEYNAQAASPGADPLAATCHLVDNLVATCGALWSLCSPPWRVQEMKDHYMEVLLGKNKATVDIEQCTVVRDYRRRELPKLEVECAPALVASSRAKFQICSHNTTTAAYSEVRDQEDAFLVLSSCCRALQRMERRCYRHLTDCLAPEDVEEVKKVHMVEIFDYLLAMAEGKVSKHQLDRCRENNNNMGELEEDELSSDEYDYEDYRYDYSDEEYSEENYDNEEEEEEEGEGGLLVEANAIPAVYNTWNPLGGESELSGGGNTQAVAGNTQSAGGKTQVAVGNTPVVDGNIQAAGANTQVSGKDDKKFRYDKNKDWEARQNVGTESHVRVEANDDATLPQKEKKLEKLSQQVKSDKVLVKKSSEHNIWEASKNDKEEIEKYDNQERKTKEKRKSEDRAKLNEWFSGAQPLPKDDNWEEDGFLDLGGGGEKTEKWGQELFVRSSQGRFEPFCTLILISSLIFKSCNT